MAQTAATYIPEHFKDAFAINWDMAAQQMESRLAPYVTIEQITGDRKRFNRYTKRGNLTVKEGRATPTKVRDQGSDLRWLDTDLYDDASQFDEWDEDFLAEISSPKSGLLASMQAACERTTDQVIVDNMFATCYVGKNGTTPSTFPNSTRNIPADFTYGSDGYTGTTPGTALGLTPDKIREGKTMLGVAQAIQKSGPDSVPVIACSERDMNALYGFLAKSNLDYNLPDVFSKELLERILGVRFMQFEDFTAVSSERYLPMWLPSGVKSHINQWRTYMDVLPTQSHALQVRVTGRLGSLRYDDDKVLRIRVKA